MVADQNAEFPAAAGRYHLYVNVGCPWAYRAVLMRRLKGLENVISMSCTQPGMGKQGWTFLADDGTSSDDFSQKNDMHEVYVFRRALYRSCDGAGAVGQEKSEYC